MTTMYGIKNCDTIKKARTWLETHKLTYDFHDYREEGLDKEKLGAWIKDVGWEKLLNKGSTTFKDLPAKDKEGLTEKKAIALMLANPTMIKRPVLERAGGVLVGFKPDVYAEAFGKKK